VIFSEERAQDCTLGGYIGGRRCLHIRDFVHEPETSLHQNLRHLLHGISDDTYDSKPSTSQRS
jgi:hypothetical protein